MKNPPFIYHRPASVDEALALLAEHDDAKVLAGGQSLLPTMALRLGPPDHLIDIGNIAELGHIATVDTEAGPGVTIGAMVRHAEAERSDLVARHAPMITAALPLVGHRAIRSRGTVVGSIAHADAAAELPAVCLATGATMTAASVGAERQIAAVDFFEGHFTTALQPNELLTSVHFPAWSPTAGGTVVEIGRRHADFAMCGLAVVIDAPDDTITCAALSFFSVASKPVRIAQAEALLIGHKPTEEVFAQAATIVTESLDTEGDIHCTAAYRRHVAGVLTRRGLAEAASRIGVAA